MKNFLKSVSVLILTVTAMLLVAEELSSGTFTFGNGKKGYLILPDNYQKGGDYKFLLFGHGRGAAAGTAGNVGTNAFKKFRQLASEKNYIIAVPPLVSTWYNIQTEKDTEEMLDFLAKSLEMDLSRIYVIGTSMGGQAALLFAGRNPERVVAVCDIFGVADIVAQSETQYKENIKINYGGYYVEEKAFYESRKAINYASVLAKIPLLIIHGEKDNFVSIKQSEDLFAAVKNNGGTQVEFIRHSSMGHQNEIIIGNEEKVFAFFEKAEK